MTDWTSPRTYTTGELVTASQMNTHVRDNESHLKEQVNDALIKTLTIGFGDAAGIVLATGVKGYLYLPFAGTILGWTLLAHESGSIQFDVWKQAYASFPPLVADTITGGEKPTLTSAQKNQDLTLTTWDVDVAAGDVLAFKIDSVTDIKQVSLTLTIQAIFA